MTAIPCQENIHAMDRSDGDVCRIRRRLFRQGMRGKQLASQCLYFLRLIRKQGEILADLNAPSCFFRLTGRHLS